MTIDRCHRDGRVVVVFLAWAAAIVAAFLTDRHFEDIDVYRAGGQAWLDGLSLYGPEFGETVSPKPLGFTYPPISAVLFSALAVVPRWLAIGAFSVAGLAALATTVWLAARRLGDKSGPALVACAVGLLVGTVAEPVRDTLTFGQINLILMALVALDCLLPRTPWPRGLLIGIAAAIKLTPAFFVLFFLARREWRPAIVAAGTAAAVTALGFALSPGDSVRYWTAALLDTGRIGQPEMAANQSVSGVLHRLGLETALWPLVAIVLVVGACVLVARLRGVGDDVGALVGLAAAGLLVSPVSWSHHWVWIAPALVYLVYRRWWIATGLAAAAFVVGPQWFLPRRDGRELEWNAVEQVAGNAYVWLALALLFWLVRAPDGTGRPRRPSGQERPRSGRAPGPRG
ncbi:Probable conserved integral membrane protein [Alloactinosynnema sp. L-07]|uniref:glycosyltransferase 87 family protein n=1 Tax=Alloactinosynnema sp. L-07 TaxID=1653480 RepID=UPI00065F06E1|nr:glycosyltransferase 87 family protein [Alloactinosynnema sp. L-07]CRK61569.1 Probable conserved integral membrane protein [Alloactinosynnema sp. L-07]